MTQAEYIESLLVDLLSEFDPTLDLDPASTLYTEVIKPIGQALEIDPMSTDAETFIRARLSEEYPNLALQDGDAVLDLLVRPMQLLLEGYRRELQIMKRGQNLSDIGLLTLEQAEDLASNFFVTRREGNLATGVVRIFFSNPTYVSIGPNTEFSTTSGLVFNPIGVFHLTPQKMLNQRSGRFYYIDIPIEAAEPGEEYNVIAGAISLVSGVNGAVRITNQFDVSGGAPGENAQQLLTRAGFSLTERSLNTRRGIRAQILELFKGVRSLEVIGYGDPEMKRDKLTGASNGTLVSSGIAMVVGSFVFLISMFEDNGPKENIFAKAGNKVDLNFSKIFYNIDDKVQSFTIQEMIFSSEEALKNLPTVYIFKLDRSPDVQTPSVSNSTTLIPGALPGVFASIYRNTEIQISTGPDLISEVLTDEVALGGKIDVLVQPSTVSTVDASIVSTRSLLSDHESTNLCTSGSIPASLVNICKKNIVATNYQLVTSSASPIQEGAAIRGQSSGAYAVVSHKSGDGLTLTLSTFNGIDFEVGEIVKEVLNPTVTSQVSTVSRDDLESIGVIERSALHVLGGADAGVYQVVYIDGPFAYLKSNLTASEINLSCRFVSKSKINLFNPTSRKYPFPSGEATGLQTTIGLSQVEVQVDLKEIEIAAGDTLEITEGSNKGVYTISGFGSQGGKFPILSSMMKATESNISYIVYNERSGLESPMIRITPGGVSSSNKPVPFSTPVGAISLEGFSGSQTEYFGVNGFVLPDPGDSWKPAANTYAKPFSLQELAYMNSIGGGVTDCYTEDCSQEGEDLICTLTLVADANNVVNLYAEGAVTSDGENYLQTLRDYFSDLVDKFELGLSFKSFIDLFGPINLGAPPSNTTPLKHYEIKLPREMFDSYNNVFVAIPEFNWKTEFAKETTFEGALDKLNNGTMVGNTTALAYAEPGDCFTIPDGPNAGSYRISKVDTVKVYLGSTVLTSNSNITGIDDTKAYDLVLVTIEGEFPHKPAHKRSTFFDDGITVANLQSIPNINIESFATVTDLVHNAGDVVSPFEVVQKAFTWLFQFLHDIGFDVDNTIDIDAGPTLQKIVEKLFVSYFHGHQSCPQDIRLMFQDPCEVVLTGSRTSSYKEWYNEVQIGADGTTGTLAAVPFTTVTEITVLLKETTSSPVVELTATLDLTELTLKNNVVELAAYIQQELDTDAENVSVAGVSASRIRFSAIKGGAGSSMLVSTNTSGGFFTNDTLFVEGSSQNSSTKLSTSIAPLNPTTVVTTSGEQTLEFAAKLTEDDYIPIFPLEDSGVGSLERDLLLSSEFSGSTVSTASSLEATDSWFKLGARKGDHVLLHEQKFILDPNSIAQNDMYRKSDRVFLIQTTKSSSTVNLIGTPDEHFRSPESEDKSDYVEVGDVLSIEAGPSKGMYPILEVFDYSLKLGSPMKSNTPSVLVKSGEGAFTSVSTPTTISTNVNNTFSSDDIGRFITIYGSAFSDTDGSYEIISVATDGSAVNVDSQGNFTHDATSLYWAVTSNNLETPGSSEVEGRTDTIAGFPFRIYSGTPKRLPIVDLSLDLTRPQETMTLYYGSSGAPKRGKKQPYRIVRPYMKLISATDMSTQNYLGLFYTDCLFTAITPDLVSNIPTYTSLVPEILSINSRGYYLSTTDEDVSFSGKEECFIIADSLWTASGEVSDTILELSDTAYLVDLGIEASAVQGYMDSRDVRVLCADPLVRTFCPSYVYFTVTTDSAGDSRAAAEAIKDFIEGLEPEDELIVSEFEKFLHRNGISNYKHPIFILILTHDIDRTISMTIDQDRISDATLKTKVTNRTTFYITGDARTSSRTDGREFIAIKGGL